MAGFDAAAQRLARNDYRSPAVILDGLIGCAAALSANDPIPVRRARKLAAATARDAIAALYLTGGSPDDIADAIDRIYPPIHGDPDTPRGMDNLLDRADRANPDDYWINGQQYAEHPSTDVHFVNPNTTTARGLTHYDVTAARPDPNDIPDHDTHIGTDRTNLIHGIAGRRR